MIKRLAILCLFWCQWQSATGQTCNFWPVGYKEAIDFNDTAKFTTSAIEHILGSNNGSEGSASIGDCNGNLLFYSNGGHIWNKNHDTMPNGKLFPHNCICGHEKCIIVPKPSSKNLFFVLYFTWFRDRNPKPYVDHFYIKQALVDMNMNGGLGGVLYKDSMVAEIDFWSMNLSWARHSNNNDFWLVFAKNEDTAFSLLVDSSGISTKLVVSSCLFETSTGPYVPGYSRFSHDFKSFITTGHQAGKTTGKLLMYHFDRATGKLTSPKSLMKHTELPDHFTNIAEFSPNDSFVYFVADTEVPGASSYLYQTNRYTLAKQVIKSFNYVNSYYWFTGMQLGPDGQIYTICGSPVSSTFEFWRIQKPDVKGINCSMVKWVDKTDDFQIYYFPDFYFPRNLKFALSSQQKCDDTSIFVYHGNGNENKIIWHFGDGDSVIQYKPIVKGDQVRHAFKKPGKYSVSVEAYSLNCLTKAVYTDTVNVIFTPKIQKHNVSETQRGCHSDSVTLTDTLAFAKTYIVDWGDGFTDTIKNLSAKDSVALKAGHKYYSIDTFSITTAAIGVNNCTTNTSSVFISRFLPKPKLNITFAGYNTASIDSPTTYTACKNFTLKLADSTTSIISSKINWGDGNSFHQNTNNGVRNFAHQYPSAGIYTLTLTDTNSNGCQTSDSVFVKVQPTPEFVFGLNNTAQCLKGNQFVISVQPSSDSILFLANWQNKADTIFIKNQQTATFKNKYQIAGEYNFNLKATNNFGCTTALDTLLKVFKQPGAIYKAIDSQTCFASNKLTIQTNPQTKSKTKISWGDGESDTGNQALFLHKYDAIGKYNWQLINTADTGSCEDTAKSKIELLNSPGTNWQIADTLFCLDSNKIEIQDPTTNTNLNRKINWGDGNEENPAQQINTHRYKTAGTFVGEAIKSLNNGCSDTLPFKIKIIKPPTANITPLFACVGLNQTFTSNIQKGDYGIKETEWQLETNPTTTGTIFNHTFSSSGIKSLKLKITDSFGCKTKINQQINIENKPQAIIKTTRKSLYEYELSSATTAKSYQWWVNNTLKGITNPFLYVFPDTGKKNIKLIVQSTLGCTDTANAFVYVIPFMQFYFPDAITINNDILNEDFGISGPQFITEYKLQIYSRWGEKVFETNNPFERWQPKQGAFGTYIYWGNLRDLNHFYHEFKGDLILIK